MSNEIKAIIVEDVKAYLNTIELLLAEVAPHVQIVAKSTSLSEAYQLITEVKPDLVLLDIQFEEEGKTSFDMLEKIANNGGISFGIIFITAHQEAGYYEQAFRYGALHFIGKPIEKEKLKIAIDRMSPKLATLEALDWIVKMKQLQRNFSGNHNSKVIVEGLKFNEVIDLNEIVFLEASGRYTNITLSTGRVFCSSQNLGEFDKKLQTHTNFFRIHHNKILNINYVSRYNKKDRLIELIPPFTSCLASKDKFRNFLKHLDSMFDPYS
jgi:two-component system, LytTR family, response regulator